MGVLLPGCLEGSELSFSLVVVALAGLSIDSLALTTIPALASKGQPQQL